LASSLPTNSSWCLPGQRKRVPYEYPSRRLVVALAAYKSLKSEPWLGGLAVERTLERTLTRGDVLAYLRCLRAVSVPLVVLDNAGIRTYLQVKPVWKALNREGIYLYFLPPYSLELNAIDIPIHP
jgi:hypothetical protein